MQKITQNKSNSKLWCLRTLSRIEILIHDQFRIEEPNPFPENPQIPTSLDRLGLLREAGTELVSNVYVAAQAREFERRKEAQEKKQGRIQKLQV